VRGVIRPRPILLILLVSLILALPASAAARANSDATGSGACATGKVSVAGGCGSRTAASGHLRALVGKAMGEMGLRAAIVRVDTGSQTLTEFAVGNSMTGTPASPDMYFRIGSMAIPDMITVLLQLQDEGRLSLDDKLSKYEPELPDASRVTLRMLANNTSGYVDWIQGNLSFVEELFENPFRFWTANELIQIALSRPPACDPGTCFHYAHTNLSLLSRVIAKVTGHSVEQEIRERVLEPLGLRHTQISRYAAFPGPALHSYTTMRGPYEDATFWSPSWTIGAGQVMAATVGDIARTARAVGSGELISPPAYRESVADTSAGLPGTKPGFYYALGQLVDNGWIIQNPMLNGYTGVMAYLPKRKLSLAIVATTRASADPEAAYATLLFERLGAYLAPGSQAHLPG
jgi:D-alanyl-D-alanine carboxypeptidase